MYAAANAVWGAETRDRQREWAGLHQEPNFGTPHAFTIGRETLVGGEFG